MSESTDKPYLGYLYAENDEDDRYQLPSINFINGENIKKTLDNGEEVIVEIENTGS